VGALWGWVMARASSGSRRVVEAAQAQIGHERAEADRVIARLRRELEESESLSKEQSEIFQVLPELIREMFATHRRGLGDLALKLVDKLLQPDQSALFAVRRARSGLLDRDFAAPGPRLVPVAVRGLKQALPDGYEIEIGQGRVGYAAEHRGVMDGADFAALGGHVGR